MYAICGASGHVGRALTEKLLNEGQEVRAIARSKEHLQPLIDLGAEPIVADLKDTEALTEAFRGARAVFALIPSNPTAPDFRNYQNEIGQAIADAIMASGVKHVVNLSSVGAQRTEGMGAVNGLHDQEERLNQLKDVNVLHLRPTFYMENHLRQIDTVKQFGMMSTPQALDQPVGEIATSDVADFAAERLMKLDFDGKSTRELLGAADITMKDVASSLGHAIGKDDLKYVQVTYDDTRNFFLGAGLSESAADNMVEMYQAFNEGRFVPTEKRSPRNTTPTTIDNFAEYFANIYRGRR
jgi:uncharacterized protein YbjT (DUF2867 family)